MNIWLIISIVYSVISIGGNLYIRQLNKRIRRNLIIQQVTAELTNQKSDEQVIREFLVSIPDYIKSNSLTSSG